MANLIIHATVLLLGTLAMSHKVCPEPQDWRMLTADALRLVPPQCFADADMSHVYDMSCSVLTAAQTSYLASDVSSTNCSTVPPLCMLSMSMEGLSGLSPRCTATLTERAIAAITTKGVSALSPEAISGITKDNAGGFSESCAGFSAKQLSMLSDPQVCSHLDTFCAAHLPAAAMPGMLPSCVSGLSQNSAGLITTECLGAMTPEAFAGFTPDNWAGVDDCKGITPGQTAGLRPGTCAATARLCAARMSIAGMAGFTRDCLSQLSEDAVGCFNAEQIGAIDPSAFDGFGANAAGMGYCSHVTAEQTGAMSRFDMCQHLSRLCAASLSLEGMSGLRAGCVQVMTLDSLAMFSKEQVRRTNPAAFAGLSPANVAALGVSCVGMNSTQTAMIGGGDPKAEVCGNITWQCATSLVPEAMQGFSTTCVSAFSPEFLHTLDRKQTAMFTPAEFDALGANVNLLSPSGAQGITVQDVKAQTWKGRWSCDVARYPNVDAQRALVCLRPNDAYYYVWECRLPACPA